MDLKSGLALTIIRTLGLLNLSGARRFGRFIGWLLKATNSRAYKVTQKNLELCFPDMSQDEREELAIASLKQTGQTIAETGIAWGGTEAKFKRNAGFIETVRNEHLFREAVSQNQGVLFLTPHMGNWEILSSWLPSELILVRYIKLQKCPDLREPCLAPVSPVV